MSETKADYGKACKCGVCGLSKIIQQIAERCTEEEKQALETLWNRMETAETNIVMDKPKEHAKALRWAANKRYIGAACKCDKYLEDLADQIERGEVVL